MPDNRLNPISKELELWERCGASQKEGNVMLGPHTSFQWNNSRRHLLFTAARYKFAMKMIGNIYEPNEKLILDLGCSDGFGTYYVAEFAKYVLGIDFDQEAISFAQAEKNSTFPKDVKVEFKLDNFLNKQYGSFDGVVSFDVIEHIYPEHESDFMSTVLMNLKDSGTFVLGTPSLETQQYSKEVVTGAHVNVYKGEQLYHMLKQYFCNVYLFTQNDEIIHTGHLRMANYLIAVCSQKKENENERI